MLWILLRFNEMGDTLGKDFKNFLMIRDETFKPQNEAATYTGGKSRFHTAVLYFSLIV